LVHSESADKGCTTLSEIEFISYCRICLSSNVQISQALLSPFFGFRLLNWEPLKISHSNYRDLVPGASYFPARTIYCQVCGGVSLGLIVDNESLINYYNDYQGEEFLASRYRLEPSFRDRMEERTSPNVLRKRGESVNYLDQIDDFVLSNIQGPIPNQVLDIGGGTGSNSPLRSKAKIDVIEISPESAYTSQESYRLVSLMNVLEHVMRPLDTLRLAVSYLDKETTSYVLIEVPLEKFMSECSRDTDIETELELGDYWQQKAIWTEHVNCFTPRALLLLANSAGLELAAPLMQFQTDSEAEDSLELNQPTAMVGLFRLSATN
jgi:hypothetical protein